MLGYEEDQTNEVLPKDIPKTPSVANKRQKYSEGTDQDWNYVLKSHKFICQSLGHVLNLKMMSDPVSEIDSEGTTAAVNPKSILFQHIRFIHFSLHLLYEDLKLNVLYSEDLLPLMKFLSRLAVDLDMEMYSLHYWKDFPEHAHLKKLAHISPSDLNNAFTSPLITANPVNIMAHIYNLLEGVDLDPYPYLANVNNRSKNIVQVNCLNFFYNLLKYNGLKN